MDEEGYLKHEQCLIQSSTNALQLLNEQNLPTLLEITEDSFIGLGRKTSIAASKELNDLREEYGDKLPYLLGLSVREAWYELFRGSEYMRLMISEGLVEDTDRMREMATAVGYGETEGIAWTLVNGHPTTKEDAQHEKLRGWGLFGGRPDINVILRCAAVCWFAAAVALLRDGNTEGAFDWIYEAQDALLFVHGAFMWDGGAEAERESAIEHSDGAARAIRTAMARAAAQARHAENRSMKADVFKWLDDNGAAYVGRGKGKGIEAAARAITRQQPIVHSTARDWYKEWKRLHPASTP